MNDPGDKGTQERFAGQLAAHRDRIFAYVFHTIGANASVAEDVTQDCLVRVWETRQKNPPPTGALYAYLRTTAQNLLRDRFRRQNRCVAIEDAKADATSTQTPEAQFVMRETVERLAAEVALMPPVLRETLRLRAIEGFDYPTIAERINCPVGTVKSRLSAARARLRNALAKSETIPPVHATTVRVTEQSVASLHAGTTVTTYKEQKPMIKTSEVAQLRAQLQNIEARLQTVEKGAESAQNKAVEPWHEAIQRFSDGLKHERKEKGGAFALGLVHIITQSANTGTQGTALGIRTCDWAGALPDDDDLTARMERTRLLTADIAVPRAFRHLYALRFAGKEMRATAAELADAVGESVGRITALLHPLVTDRTLLLTSDGTGGETYEWEGNDPAITTLLFAAT